MCTAFSVWGFLSELKPLIVFCDYSSVRREGRDSAFFLFNNAHYYSCLLLLLSFTLVKHSIFVRLSYFRLQLRNSHVICYYTYIYFFILFSISVRKCCQVEKKAFSLSHWTWLLGTWVTMKSGKQLSVDHLMPNKVRIWSVSMCSYNVIKLTSGEGFEIKFLSQTLPKSDRILIWTQAKHLK